jgi:hypothetical protein
MVFGFSQIIWVKNLRWMGLDEVANMSPFPFMDRSDQHQFHALGVEIRLVAFLATKT